ncbi:MAG: hypothetical protein KAT70_00735 [Thermoplasmata archaeon]|nr:hypothetical protein [Thermoplasmata archaeon]
MEEPEKAGVSADTPPSTRNNKLLAIVSIAVVAVVIAATYFVFFMDEEQEEPLGRWNGVKMLYTDMDSGEVTPPQNISGNWIEFKAGGTGAQGNATTTYPFTWKLAGNGEIELLNQETDKVIVWNYTIDGDTLTMEYTEDVQNPAGNLVPVKLTMIFTKA